MTDKGGKREPDTPPVRDQFPERLPKNRQQESLKCREIPIWLASFN
jgi:hypothetical protein